MKKVVHFASDYNTDLLELFNQKLSREFYSIDPINHQKMKASAVQSAERRTSVLGNLQSQKEEIPSDKK